MKTPVPVNSPNPMIPDLVRFYRNDAERVRAVVRYVEQMVRFEGVGRDTHHPGATPFMYGYAPNSTSAANGATLGGGTFHPCAVNGGTLTANNGTTYSFTNAGGAVNAGKYGLFGWCGGGWTAVVFPCN